MLRTLMAALAATVLSTAAMAGNCTTDTPVDAANVTQAATDIWNGGAWDGTGHFAGTANCPDAKDNTGELISIAAALSSPVWLEANERFAFSGGLGFSGDGDTALGINGLMRFDKGLSGFAGAAVSTDSSDNWGGHVGIRAGF